MRQQNIKTPLVFRIGGLLFCLLLISMYMMGGLYARYTASASGTDGARVAQFAFAFDRDLMSETVTAPISLAPGETDTKTVSITNNGETAIRCVVTLENLTKNLPIAVEAPQVITTEAIPGGQSDTCNIVIKWPKELNSIDFAEKMDVFKITVTVEQVD